MKVVFDAGVVFAGAGWRGEAYRCLIALAQRRIIAYATEDTLRELRDLFGGRKKKTRQSIGTILQWYENRVKVVEPAPLGKQRSRDAKDDPYLACALGAGAKISITRDEDLLVLKKPFGIEMVTPRELLARLARRD